jgi:hypothetical protein
MGRGERALHGYNADVAPSVIDRMRADPAILRDKDDSPAKTPYRPANVLRFLAGQPNLDAYLQQIGVEDLDTKPLPADVVQKIQQLRETEAAGVVAGTANAH